MKNFWRKPEKNSNCRCKLLIDSLLVEVSLRLLMGGAYDKLKK